MCGIVGSVGVPWESSVLDTIRHRGPDDEGFIVDDTLALGHQRLSILDLSPNGHQPMQTEDESVTIVFNGEIYNHQEIRKKLGFKKFKSSSDTETILYAYKEFGTSVFKGFNGIFAFALYDKEKK
jgi:asparagine synthase (glutamine-hydrolysing)